MSAAPQIAAESLPQTPLAEALQTPAGASVPHQGALAAYAFSAVDKELAALTANAGIYDLGYMAFLRITGGDRLRWLNGMVSNAIQTLPEGRWNYSFLLNAQGRNLGDANIYRNPEDLILQTARSQLARLSAHLDHFIIMDDVELQTLDASHTAIGMGGPRSAEVLAARDAVVPGEGAFVRTTLAGAPLTLVHAHSPVVPRFELWLSVQDLPRVWRALEDAGAAPCGVAAVEALRILEGTPLHGRDIHERHLAQETSQTRALNFNKGCYLGQEIVERIRSRATVHRALRQFSLENAPSALEPGEVIQLNAEGAERNPVGELTSLAQYALPAFTGSLALGFIRTEAVERNLPLTHAGGKVTVLNTPPTL